MTKPPTVHNPKPATPPNATKVDSKAGGKAAAGTAIPAKATAAVKDVDADMFKEMNEMNSFGSEEDKALAT